MIKVNRGYKVSQKVEYREGSDDKQLGCFYWVEVRNAFIPWAILWTNIGFSL